MTTRVQIPAYTDMWMRGDRYGTVTKVARLRTRLGERQSRLPQTRVVEEHDVAFVKLDVSGKTVRVILDDCTVV